MKVLSKSLSLFFMFIIAVSSPVNAQNALDFDGIDDYVYTTYSGITSNSARSIEAWIKTTAVSDPNSGGSQQVIADYGTFVTGGRFTFCMVWNNSIRIEVGGNGLSGTTAINDGQWHHVAVTYDPNLTTNQYKLYIDGSLETQGNLTVSTNTIAGTQLQIGKRIDGAKMFDGTIDEVRFWSDVRSPAEISQNRNTEFCLPANNLVAYYKFNNGTAGGTNTGLTTLTDHASTYNGTLSGFSLSGSSSNWVSGATLNSGVILGGLSSVTACNSWTAPDGSIYTTSILFTDTITSASGCDSVFSVDLTIHTNTSSVINPTACNTYISPSGNQTWISSGTYYDTIPNSNGCDSSITINLTIVQLNTGVSQSGFQLSSLQSGANYQWLDCNNSFALIPGATSQSFTPSTDGDYAVEISLNSCTDTSACMQVTGIGLNESLNRKRIKIYPNPLTTNLFVELDTKEDIKVSLISIAGQTIYQEEFRNDEKVKIDLSNFKNGLYILRVDSDTDTFKELIIKN
jgi:hypothetical protein